MSTAKKLTTIDVIKKIAIHIGRISGNVLKDKQFPMIESRLKKRIIELGLKDYDEYYSFYTKHEVTETNALISLLTTHHTFFFREFLQFEVLEQRLKKIIQNAKDQGRNKIMIWSAACSKGQEVYTLALFLEYHMKKIAPMMDYEIWGSDIDDESVKFGMNGVYLKTDIDAVPAQYLGDHFAKGKGDIAHFVKVKDHIRNQCKFFTNNLMKFAPNLNGVKFDIIFCRNVFIYFKMDDVKSITQKFQEHLFPSGYIFTGVSESLSTLELNLKPIGPSIYQYNTDEKPHEISIPQVASFAKKAPRPKIRVLSVDDSRSVIKILEHVFKSDNRFEFLGSAENGIEAHKKIAELKPDIVTLDIHMPEMNGVNYLEKYFNSSHPPVVMISSVSRDDQDLALKSLRLGASDFVHKPSMENFEMSSEEILNKVYVAFKNSETKVVTDYDQENAHHLIIKDTDKYLRVGICNISDAPKIVRMLDEIKSMKQPATILLFSGNDHILETFTKEFKDKTPTPVEYIETLPSKLNESTVYIAPFEKLSQEVKIRFITKKVAVLIFGTCTKTVLDKFANNRNYNILCEDLDVNKGKHKEVNDYMPATSFAYVSTNYFYEDENK
ncbi:MAG: response regulator [Halobacteriovoraceae bacterium]|nr:response regulator [Halobacteriovoraceae bacterium]